MNVWAQQQLALLQMAASAPPYMQMQGFQQANRLGMPQPAPPMNLDEESESDEDDEQKRTLFVANLDERVTEELLYELFLQAGPIETVRIPKDNNGKQRTFGFITYVHLATADYAMRLYQGTTLFRKTLTIKGQAATSSSAPQRRAPPNGDSFNTRLNEFAALRNQSTPPVNVEAQQREPTAMVRNPFSQQARELPKADKRNDGNDRHSRKHDSPFQRNDARHGEGDRRDHKEQHGNNQKHFRGGNHQQKRRR